MSAVRLWFHSGTTHEIIGAGIADIHLAGIVYLR
jgi:hypothetical protein